MARSRNRGRRDANVISSHTPHRQRHYDKIERLHSSPLVHRPGPRVTTSPSRPHVDDRRTYHPFGELRPINRYDGRPVTLVDTRKARRELTQAVHRILRTPPSHDTKKTVLRRSNAVHGFVTPMDSSSRAVRAFSDPVRTPLCRARQQRREVIHAKGHAGSRVAKPRFTERSDLKC